MCRRKGLSLSSEDIHDQEIFCAQVVTPKSAAQASAMKQALDERSRLLAQLECLCLDRGLLLLPEGPGSVAAGKNCLSISRVYPLHISHARVPIAKLTRLWSPSHVNNGRDSFWTRE